MSDILLSGDDRRQELFLPKMIDEYVEEDNEVRFIDAFVNWLDMKTLGFKHAEPSGGAGRAPYNPRPLLALFIWGYLNAIRSSRKLERECRRNLEAKWLIKNLTPDFKTIADFRKDNIDCIKPIFRMFVNFLKDLDLIEGKLASIDGTKIKAWNSTKRYYNAAKLAFMLKRIDEESEKYLKELQDNDKITKEEVEEDINYEAKKFLEERSAYLKKRLDEMEENKKELSKRSKQLEKSGRREISLTDPDSRLMKNNHRFELCYNSEASVDEKNKLIVDYDVVNEPNDEKQLAPMATRTKNALGVDELDVVADQGFGTALQVKECLENGITPYVPLEFGQGAKKRVPDPVSFGRDKFLYNKEKDVYVCPAGNEMSFSYWKNDNAGKRVRVYETSFKCNGCPFRSSCTTNKTGRKIERWESQEIIDEIRDKVKYEPEKMALRRELSEHPFGTIKRNFNQGYFLMKGLRKVKGEFGYSVLVYDIRRALNILGISGLLHALPMTPPTGGTARPIK
jgi:transposase